MCPQAEVEAALRAAPNVASGVAAAQTAPPRMTAGGDVARHDRIMNAGSDSTLETVVPFSYGRGVDRQGLLTTRFDEALTYALHAHDTQQRKGTAVPYAAHLMSVAALVLEAGGSEHEAIIGLLHDAVEDAGGAGRLADIRTRFGDEIADAVLECSAEDKTDDPGWAARKDRYVAALATCSTTALRVSLADKVHNARSILADYRTLGDALWRRFNAPDADALLGYYDRLADAYGDRAPEIDARLLAELRRAIGELRLLLPRPCCGRCGAGDVVPVIVGMPSPDEYAREAAGQVEFAGCIIGEDTPDWACQVCGHHWQDPEHPHSW